MKILVTAKRVPDPEQKVKFKGNAIDNSATNWQLSQFDEYAIETALRLNENASAGAARQGEVIALSIGPKDVQQQLRSALAMGADRGILVEASGDDQLDADVVARVLQKVVETEKPDLILLGKLATDSESNDVGQRLAGLLNVPQATFACSIEATDGRKALLVGREVDAGVETKKVTLPAVVTVDLRIVAPQAVKNGVTDASFAYPEGARYASLKGIMAAKKKPIAEQTLASFGVGEPKVKLVAAVAPPARAAGVKVQSVEELVGKLRNEAKVL